MLGLTLYVWLFMAAVEALNCQKGELANYRFQEEFTEVTGISQLLDTPPSKTNMTWYLNICNEKESINEDCPKNSQICGVKEVLLPGQGGIKTEIISLGNGLNNNVEVSNKTDVVVQLDESSWGSNSVKSVLKFHCAKEEDVKVSWNGGEFVLDWYTPGSCLKSDKSVPDEPKKGKGDDGDDDKKNKKEKDDSWGWFTWVFIIFVLVFGAYIIMGAWITLSKSPADFQDAVNDFKDTLKNLATSFPGFVSEIFEKLFGGGNRGGYSAV